MPPSPKLFLAIATGNRIANLPPILELAEQGDGVLWLLTPAARANGWVDGPERVLSRRGILSAAECEIDPEAGLTGVASALDAALYRLRTAFPGRPCLVCNGGKKMDAFRIFTALRGRVTLAYGEDRPVRLDLYGDPDQPPVHRTYRRCDLDLPDILECNGYDPHPRSGAANPPPARIWGEGGAHEPFFAAQARAYLSDTGLRRALHARQHETSRQWITRDETAFVDAAGACAPEREKFRACLESQLRNLARESGARLDRATLSRLSGAITDRQLSALYGAALGLERAARIKFMHPQAPVFPGVLAGSVFEHAVALRLRDWLDARGEEARAVVRSVWSQVPLRLPGGDRTNDRGEFDLVIVMRNGILFQLECKSSPSDEADATEIMGRDLRMRAAASSLAQTAVCVPWYTDESGEAWFAPMHKRWLYLASRVNLIPFTMPGQSGAYQWSDPEGMAEYSIPTFESSLARMLSPCFHVAT